ncbi:MAG TPA: 2,4'-dihydroxyacetophenone dioxygenase family protein [Rhodanobacteraceae bacterium]|jgi:quercetin dioxygenase-like cupin family protein|nr:2,4'-dihydroxyacetophenone dioxygenase family protein [Rhodanobacteraceae bacterium]
MNQIAMQTLSAASEAFLPAQVLAQDGVPWVPLSPGKSFKPLRFLRDDRGFVELLRLAPGETIPLHRHTGEVHAFNLEGSRQLCTGEVVWPGDYVYEPAGNVDWWKAIGDVPLIVLVIVMGAIEYLDGDGRISRRYTARTLEDLYREHCVARGIATRDLVS